MQDGETLNAWPTEGADEERPANSREKGLNRVLNMLEFLHAN
ncbi:IclR family transcriptional regulator, partial [Mesorhizobium sp. M00.F.Ca.ET.149.01.1.1]